MIEIRTGKAKTTSKAFEVFLTRMEPSTKNSLVTHDCFLGSFSLRNLHLILSNPAGSIAWSAYYSVFCINMFKLVTAFVALAALCAADAQLRYVRGGRKIHVFSTNSSYDVSIMLPRDGRKVKQSNFIENALLSKPEAPVRKNVHFRYRHSRRTLKRKPDSKAKLSKHKNSEGEDKTTNN